MEFLDDVGKKIGLISEKGTTETIFGPPKEIDGTTIIPVGRMVTSFGFGGGSGKGPSQRHGEAGEMEQSSEPEGEGGGGGGRVAVVPVAVVEVREGVSRVRPVVDYNQIVKYAGIAVGILAFWLGWVLLRLSKDSKKD